MSRALPQPSAPIDGEPGAGAGLHEGRAARRARAPQSIGSRYIRELANVRIVTFVRPRLQQDQLSFSLESNPSARKGIVDIPHLTCLGHSH